MTSDPSTPDRPDATAFPTIRFLGQLRPSQRKVVEIARRQLAGGERRLHIVAPPGSGKTVLGLFLWAECVRTPALVLSPNTAIQMQWVARGDLFGLDGDNPPPLSTLISNDPEEPRLLTSLTYQSVTLPRRGGENLDMAARRLWIERLIEKEQAANPHEAEEWIDDLARNNSDYFNDRLATYRKKIRDEAALEGESLAMLHGSSRATLERIRDANVGLVILDECHHLMGHWGRVLADAHELLGEPIIVGLTATPPDPKGKTSEDIERYKTFFGPVDFDVPVPAVVKDGYLAPYQDLAYFVRPTADELRFIADVDDQLHAVVEEFCRLDGTEPLPAWVSRVLAERQLGATVAGDWQDFERRDGAFSWAARAFLTHRKIPLPAGVPPLDGSPGPDESPDLELLSTVLDRYIRHRLRRSDEPRDHELAERAIRGLRSLGVQVTETGRQACASPAGRVMAYSLGKAAALRTILAEERRVLGESIRAVVVTDYEKTSAVTAEISHLLDDEAGGAVAAFKTLLGDRQTDLLDPVLVTGSSVLVDNDVADKFLVAANEWLGEQHHDVGLEFLERDGFKLLIGRGGDWSPRIYVRLITELFQRGLTKCLVGTRGLLGEGWDANRINVLIDLTTVTTSMSVNQLRGRSIRLDPERPKKLADNWDVVCVAPEFAKGLDDYTRFRRKHKTIFGVTDDGAIEKGVGHVHAAFTELKPEGVEGSAAALNSDMLARVAKRSEARALWRIGEPYHPEPIKTLEVSMGGGGGFPPFQGVAEAWSSGSLARAIGEAVLGALCEAQLILQHRDVQIGERDGGYVRVFLAESTEEESGRFSDALREALGPLERPRYVIPRSVDKIEETLLSRLLPGVIGRYFRKFRREMVMLHAVPDPLAKKKQLVEIYQRHWNRHVSPGEAFFAHRGEGERMLEQCRRNGLVPDSAIHEKEVFLSKSVTRSDDAAAEPPQSPRGEGNGIMP